MKKKEKDPSFLFYPKDWVVGTFDFNAAQKGCFIDLLAMQHSKGALEYKTIQKICYELDTTELQEVLEKFKRNPDGTYFNTMLANVMMKREEYKKNQSDLAKKRWRNKMPRHMPTDMPTHMPTECLRVENVNENENGTEIIDSISSLSIGDLEGPSFNSLEDLFFNTPSED